MGFRRILVIALCIGLPLTGLAAGLQGQAEIAFAEGLIAYQEQDYVGAQLYFDRAAQLNPQHESAAFFRGLSSYQRGQYAKAIPDFKAAAAANPQAVEPHYYQGLAYYHLNRKDEALRAFKQTYKQAPPGDISRNASNYIAEITGTVPTYRGRHGKPWFFFANVGTLYDSNVSLDPEDLTLATLPSDQDDIQISAYVGAGYHLVSGPVYRFTSAASYYQAFYPDLNSFDFGLARAELRHQWTVGKFLFKLPFAYEFSLLGHDKYMQRPEVAPSIAYWAGKQYLIRMRTRLRYNDFFQNPSSAAQDRDAWNMGIELAQFFYFDKQRRYFKLSYNFERNWAQGNDWDYLAHTIGAAFFNPIVWKIDSYLFATYTVNRDYDNVDSIFGSRRQDNYQNYGIRFSRPIVKGLSLSLHYGFQRNRSNLAIFQYNKHTAGVTFAFRI